MRLTIAGPSMSVKPRKLSIDKQFPRVLAIGTPNFAPVAASRKSQALASAIPPPTAQPSTTATVGFVTAFSALTK